MSGMVVILLFIIFIAWLAIDLGVGKKVFSQAENTFPKRRASLFLFADGNVLYKDLFHEIENASSFIHLS
ncbi:cardiolipin synthase, partial [Priestia megaterium]